jgi:hypothetical protein
MKIPAPSVVAVPTTFLAGTVVIVGATAVVVGAADAWLVDGSLELAHWALAFV